MSEISVSSDISSFSEKFGFTTPKSSVQGNAVQLHPTTEKHRSRVRNHNDELQYVENRERHSSKVDANFINSSKNNSRSVAWKCLMLPIAFFLSVHASFVERKKNNFTFRIFTYVISGFWLCLKIVWALYLSYVVGNYIDEIKNLKESMNSLNSQIKEAQVTVERTEIEANNAYLNATEANTKLNDLNEFVSQFQNEFIVLNSTTSSIRENITELNSTISGAIGNVEAALENAKLAFIKSNESLDQVRSIFSYLAEVNESTVLASKRVENVSLVIEDLNNDLVNVSIRTQSLVSSAAIAEKAITDTISGLHIEISSNKVFGIFPYLATKYIGFTYKSPMRVKLSGRLAPIQINYLDLPEFSELKQTIEKDFSYEMEVLQSNMSNLEIENADPESVFFRVQTFSDLYIPYKAKPVKCNDTICLYQVSNGILSGFAFHLHHPLDDGINNSDTYAMKLFTERTRDLTISDADVFCHTNTTENAENVYGYRLLISIRSDGGKICASLKNIKCATCERIFPDSEFGTCSGPVENSEKLINNPLP